jgi:predicted ThiF/HesA family dinucleotide-utilizing enzyme
MIPYHLQYETRDFNRIVQKSSQKVLMNREKYIKEFNPYLKSNVSENLDEKILKFYRERYLTRW